MVVEKFLTVRSDVGILTPFIIILTATLAVLTIGLFFSFFSPIANQLLPQGWNQTYESIEFWAGNISSLLPLLALVAILALILSGLSGRRRKVL